MATIRYVFAILLVGSIGVYADGLPTSGAVADELLGLDGYMQSYLEQHDIPAATVGVMYNGKFLMQRSYGWFDAERTMPLAPNAMMRLASVSKPITAATIHQLIDAGTLNLDDKVFDVGQPGGGIVPVHPSPSIGDPRIADITIRNLLAHRGGWDRDIVVDYAFSDVLAALHFGFTDSFAPTLAQKMDYILGTPLQHDPGSQRAYSNIGYMALGMAIEQVFPGGYLEAVQQLVFDPLGVPRTEVERGRSLVEDRNPREPFYSANGLGDRLNLFNPSGPLVPYPDGGFNLESLMGAGDLIASNRAILHLLDNFRISASNAQIGTPWSGDQGVGTWWWHSGSLPGTNVAAVQRGNGLNYVIALDERYDNGDGYVDELVPAFNSILLGMDLSAIDEILDLADGTGDGWLTLEDVDAFNAALLGGEAGLRDLFPNAHYRALDFTDDGIVDANDIEGFVDYMIFSGFQESEIHVVPEISGFTLMSLAFVLTCLSIAFRRRVSS